MKDIGRYLQASLLETDLTPLAQLLQKLTAAGSKGATMDTEKVEANHNSGESQNEEVAIKKMKLLRSHLILFAKFFECEDGQEAGSFETAKLQSIEHTKVEALFWFLKIDLPLFSTSNISKKFFREAESLVYCSLSALANYFVFLKEVSKTPITINGQFFTTTEQPLLSIMACVTESKSDARLFEHVTSSFAKTLLALADLCQPAVLRESSQLPTEVD